MRRTFVLAFLLVFLAVAGSSQAIKQLTDLLLVVPDNFKLMATNVSYRGESCVPSLETDKVYSDSSEVIKVGDDVYYQALHFYRSGVGDGLVAENFTTKTCRVYRMFGLAEAAGWVKPKEGGGPTPDATRGLFRVGNTLWMGSNGIGLAVFDLERKTWSRFDVKSSVVAGDHLGVDYADENYVFVTRTDFPGPSLHIYSMKQDRWLGLKAVSTDLVREFGYTTGRVSVGVDHRVFSKQKYLPVDLSFVHPKITLTNNGKSYLFERKFAESRTVFEVSKSQLQEVFMKT